MRETGANWIIAVSIAVIVGLVSSVEPARASEDCYACHKKAIDKYQKFKFAHKPVRDKNCESCHQPHGDAQKLILKADGSGLCYLCHGDLAPASGQKNVHAPVADGDCNVCHEAHGSDHDGLVVAAGPDLCGACHAIDESLSATHGGYNMTTADCLGCHNPHLSEQPKLVRRIAHQPFADKDCESCHEKDAEGKIVLSGPLTDLCSACHESVSEAMDMKHPHAPFAGDECGSCHGLHVADNEKLLKTGGEALCLMCHEDVRGTSPSLIHRPVEEGKCGQCHLPHASQNAMLLARPAESLCFGCHNATEQEIAQGEPHAPAAGGECGSCHKAHHSTETALLTAPKIELCGACHDMQSREIRAAHKGFPLSEVNCQNCHAAHAGPEGSKGLLLPDPHPAFADGTCTTCHEGLRPHKLVAGITELCFSCHEDFISDPANPFVHASVKSDKGCLSCHGAHVGYGPKLLLNKEGTALCLSCHDGEAFQGSVKHPQAFEDCGVCHKHHAADNKELLTNPDIVVLCTDCHTDALKTHFHPIGAGTLDRRTGKPLTCVGCHKAHSSNHNAILIAENDKSFCISCHSVSK